MRLQKLAPKDPSVRLNLAMKQSTTELLDLYQARYQQSYGETIDRQVLIEQMLLSFMAEDKEFQRSLQGNKSAAK